MHRNPLNPHCVSLHPSFFIHLLRFQSMQRRHPFITNHPAEYRVLPIQMRRRSIRDEELTPIRIWAFIRHGNYPTRIVSQRRANLIFEIGAPDWGADFRRSWCGRASLDHEARDGAVERRGIVGGGGAEGEEVLIKVSDIWKELKWHVPGACILYWYCRGLGGVLPLLFWGPIRRRLRFWCHRQ